MISANTGRYEFTGTPARLKQSSVNTDVTERHVTCRYRPEGKSLISGVVHVCTGLYHESMQLGSGASSRWGQRGKFRQGGGLPVCFRWGSNDDSGRRINLHLYLCLLVLSPHNPVFWLSSF